MSQHYQIDSCVQIGECDLFMLRLGVCSANRNDAVRVPIRGTRLRSWEGRRLACTAYVLRVILRCSMSASKKTLPEATKPLRS